MRAIAAAIRRHWTETDTIVLSTNFAAFLFFWGNCWWGSLGVTYGAAVIPLAVQVAYMRRGSAALREALVFGGVVGWLWPLGEWLVVHGLGWWGEYLAEGPRILETPLYCSLIGWLASAYCYYVGRRALDWGFRAGASGVMSGLSAFLIGVAGENFFVAAGMWRYEPSDWDWWEIPAFVPVSYGIAYGLLPVYRRLPVVAGTLVFLVVTLVICVGLGIAVGFFPR